jgi:hypothetical protein
MAVADQQELVVAGADHLFEASETAIYEDD